MVPTPKEVGVNAITAHVLCARHNHALSPTDDGQAEAIRAIRAIRRQRDTWITSRFRGAAILHRVIDGELLERWLLKTAINLTVTYNSTNLIAESIEPGRPPLRLVEAAFGIRPLGGAAGLHGFMSVGESTHDAGQFIFQPFSNGSRTLGASAHFGGVRFLITFPLESQLAGVRHAFPSSENPIRHLRAVRFDAGGTLVAVLEIRWPDRPPLYGAVTR